MFIVEQSSACQSKSHSSCSCQAGDKIKILGFTMKVFFIRVSATFHSLLPFFIQLTLTLMTMTIIKTIIKTINKTIIKTIIKPY